MAQESPPPLMWGPSGTDTVCGSDCMKAANMQIPVTQQENDAQTKLAGLGPLLNLRPLGLSLTVTPSFLDLVEKKKLHLTKDEVTASNHSSRGQAQAQAQAQVKDYGQQVSEKMKASNFAALFVKIGSWERLSRNDGDMVAKCYYAKRKLVWEFLEGRLKKKIEIQWSDILSMEAIIQDNRPGILHIELNQQPTFYEEIDPLPKKHTMWKLSTDFTKGEANKCRRHYLVFPSGSLDKHYAKLLQCDERLRQLSSKPFPSLPESPYFPDSIGFADYSFGNNAHMLDIRPGMQFAYPGIPSPFSTIQQPSLQETPSPVSGSAELTGNQVIENPMMEMEVWGQGMNACGDTVATALVQGNSAAPYQNYNQVNPVASWENNTQVDPISDLTLTDSCQEVLSEFENHLFSDSEIAYFDENYRLARMRSWASLINLVEEEENSGSNSNASMPTAFEHANGLGGLCYQQPVPTITPQVSLDAPVVHPPYHFYQQNDYSPMLGQASPENSLLHQPSDSFCSSYTTSAVPDPSMESFSSFNSFNEVNYPWSVGPDVE